MAVERFTLIPTQSGRIGSGYEREYVETYQVRVSDWRDNQLTIWMHKQCPKKGDRHSFDNLAFVTEIDCNRIGNSKFHWEVIVKYSSVKEQNQDEPDPLKEKPRIRLKSSNSEEEAYADIYGDPIMTTAGDPIPGVMVDRLNWTIDAEINMDPDFPSWLGQLGERPPINNADIRIEGLLIPKETLKLSSIDTGFRETKNDREYRPFAFEFQFDQRGWRKRLLNAGFNCTSLMQGMAINGKWHPFKERILINGEPPTDPQFLNKKGERLHTVQRIRGKNVIVYNENPTAKDIVILEKEVYPGLDFTIFQLNR